MLGFWKGNRKPMFTTGNEFLENFIFFIPRGGLILFLITVVPYYLIKGTIFPNYEYKYDAYGEQLIVKYTVDGDQVTGDIFWTYRASDDATDYETSYTLKSKFQGQQIGNTINIILENPNIEKPTVIAREVPSNQTLIINGDNITFMDKTAKGGRSV